MLLTIDHGSSIAPCIQFMDRCTTQLVYLYNWCIYNWCIDTIDALIQLMHRNPIDVSKYNWCIDTQLMYRYTIDVSIHNWCLNISNQLLHRSRMYYLIDQCVTHSTIDECLGVWCMHSLIHRCMHYPCIHALNQMIHAYYLYSYAFNGRVLL